MDEALISRRTRIVRLWLTALAMLIFAMVLVGGATRLTESGLSIVEWKPVTGTLPPLGAKAWDDAFAAYRAIPQYRELNAGMTLEDFKTIYWWEWSHRLLGRVIGIAYLLPFLFFLWRGWIVPDLKRRLWVIFGLGALQGAVGWWMVASGLTERTEVSQLRLATHLILAVAIFAAIVWTVRGLAPVRAVAVRAAHRIVANLILALIFAQLYLGALVAGLRAGRIYNTWPLIDGALIPDASRLWFERPWWRNLSDNMLTVQFNHRMVAYALCALALWHLVALMRARAPVPLINGALMLAVLITLQAVLGIFTLLTGVMIALGLAHQALALIVLTAALFHAELASRRHARAAPRAIAAPVSLRFP